jgi:hypothetical protein
LVLTGLRDQRQYVFADIARRRAHLIQRRLCVEIAEAFKR